MNTEIVVVLDKPEKKDEVQEMLSNIPHSLIVTSGRRGGAHARNMGLSAATGDFIAYLDDDDFWEPEKLSIQIASLLDHPNTDNTICVSSTVFYRADTRSVLPTRPFNPQTENIVDYLVQRKKLKYGDQFMQTSSLVGPAKLLKKYPWDESLKKHQDWDLFARLLDPQNEVNIIHRSEAFVNVYQHSSNSVSARPNWNASRLFYTKHKEVMNRQSRADFIWSQILRASLAQKSLGGVAYSLMHMFAGIPNAPSVIVGLHGAIEN